MWSWLLYSVLHPACFGLGFSVFGKTFRLVRLHSCSCIVAYQFVCLLCLTAYLLHISDQHIVIFL